VTGIYISFASEVQSFLAVRVTCADDLCVVASSVHLPLDLQWAHIQQQCLESVDDV